MTIQKHFKNHLNGIITPNTVKEAKHWVWLFSLALDNDYPVGVARYYGFDYVDSENDIYKAIAYLSGIVARSE